MQQATLFAILMILINKRKVSRDYLAERFSISKRTVSRYIAVLEDAGVPICSVAGANGGISLSDDFMIDKTFFSQAETIRLKEVLAKTENIYDDKVNKALSEKLDSINKSREQDNYAVKQDELYIDCDYGQAASLRPKIKTLSQAIQQSRILDIKYTDARGCVSYRSIEPYTLVFKVGAWYIYAMCDLRGEFRLFKLSRISDLRITSKRFVKTDSKLLEKLELEFYNEYYIDLEFEFFPTVLENVTDWLGASAVTERGTKYVACAEVPYTKDLLKRLLSFGSSINVLNPADIRDKLKAEAKRMIDIYE